MWLPCDIFVKDDNEVDLMQQILQLLKVYTNTES